MRDQHRHAVGRSRGDADAFDSRDQRIPFFIGDRVREVGARDRSHLGPMHLALLEQAIDTKPEAIGETAFVLVNCHLIVTQVEAQVEAVVGCGAHATQARGKRVAESVLNQKGGMQSAHRGMFSTPNSGQRAVRLRSTRTILREVHQSRCQASDVFCFAESSTPYSIQRWAARIRWTSPCGISGSRAERLTGGGS